MPCSDSSKGALTSSMRWSLATRWGSHLVWLSQWYKLWVQTIQVYSYFRKYQEQHFKRFPHKPELEERWKAFREKQAGAKKEEEKEPAPKVEAAKQEQLVKKVEAPKVE